LRSFHQWKSTRCSRLNKKCGLCARFFVYARFLVELASSLIFESRLRILHTASWSAIYFQLVIVCPDIIVFGFGCVVANTANVLRAILFRKNIKLMIHGAAADADLSGPGGFSHRIKSTASGTVISLVSYFSATSAAFGCRMIARIIRLPIVFYVSNPSALGADAAVPGMLLIPLLAAFGADAAVPGVLFIPLFTAFGADASVPCVLFIPFFAAFGADAAIPGMLK
jgi:hypothetical protein